MRTMDMRLATVWMMFSLVLLSGFGQFVICSEGKGKYSGDNVMRMMNLGEYSNSKNDQNGGEDIDDIARFAVQEHNKRENAVLELVRVVKSTEQVVAGKLYHLTLEVIEAGKKKIYEAKVWEKPWMNFKQLQEFKKVVPSFTVSDLGLKPDGNGFDWKSLSTKNPEVQEAAKHAMKSIQQKSNSLHHYKHMDIVLARAKMVEDHVNFELLLKLERDTAMKLISLRHAWFDGNGFDWRSISTKNPEVQEAAKHAMKSIQHKSNSLYPYKLADVILARAKIVKDHVNFELLLKIERGNKLEKLMVKVMKNHHGKYE